MNNKRKQKPREQTMMEAVLENVQAFEQIMGRTVKSSEHASIQRMVISIRNQLY